MTIVKKAVTAKAYDILCKYKPENIKELYGHLYENIKDASISSGLSSLHQRIDELFRFMNQKNTVNKHYNAGESRELLSIIRDIKELKKLFMSLGYNLKIDDYYSNRLQYTKTFLDESGGSGIPADYTDIEIKDVEPIFDLLKENEIVAAQNIEKITQESAREQIKKCYKRIEDVDYSGAIAISMTLVQGVIKDIYKKITGKEMGDKENLIRNWNNLAQELNLHSEKAPSDALRQVLSGLSSIINGLATMRNKMSDSHGLSKFYKADKRHAVLAVNAALTIIDFLFDTYEHQVKKEIIKPQQKED